MMMTLPFMKRSFRLLSLAVVALLAAPTAFAQYIPYFGKNKVNYDKFAWRVYKSPHFEVFYYPEFEQHLGRLVSYLESSYQHISSELKHEIQSSIPVVFYKTHSEFEQTNLFPDFVPEQVQAFSEPIRNRMVIPVDGAPDRLQGLITHELAHIFEFDLIPRGFVSRGIPLWVDEGLADYLRGEWDSHDLMTVRDAALNDQIPRMSKMDVAGGRTDYNLGHAVFDFMAARFGKEGIRQFLYTLRKSIIATSDDSVYQQAFRMTPKEFDEAFEKWTKERFKPFRDRQRPTDYGSEISPDPEKTSFSQVYAFAPSPSGEIVAAITGNRTDGEADIVMLSTKDGSVVKNLTKGYTGKYENVTFPGEGFVTGRTIDFSPKGDVVTFVGRTGKKRSLFLVSPLSGDVVKRIPLDLDEVESPCILPNGKQALIAATKEGVADIYLVNLETGETKNLTQDAFFDANPRISPDGTLVVYNRRVSGNYKIVMFPIGNPSRRIDLTYGPFADVSPYFSADGTEVLYSSNEDDGIYNLRSIDIKTGVIKQYTDAMGGNMAPAPLKTAQGDRIGFITYFKGEYQLYTLDPAEPTREVEQATSTAPTEVVDFEPDVTHQVVAENKRRKRLFEGLYLEGRPPLNVGFTSNGDFFGGSQVALTDVLGDQSFVFTASSVREYRNYAAQYANLSSRWNWGITASDFTYYYFSPYQYSSLYTRDGALATERYTGAIGFAVYPLNKFNRIQFSGGYNRVKTGYQDPFIEQEIQQQAALLGQARVPIYDGSTLPLSIGYTRETTRFREFGPLAGSTINVSYELSPKLGSFISRRTFEFDARKYMRVGGTSMLLATRVRAFSSSGDQPRLFGFGGNMEMRGYNYNSFVGSKGGFAAAELRIPLIDVMLTPIGLLGPVRGTVFGNVGAAHYPDEPFTFSTTGPGVSFVNDPLFGQQVDGRRLVDGRASFGVGVQAFLLGMPMHFDWSWLTDLKVRSTSPRFQFWVGYDF
jgi:Tol biopolymer transport system component